MRHWFDPTHDLIQQSPSPLLHSPPLPPLPASPPMAPSKVTPSRGPQTGQVYSVGHGPQTGQVYSVGHGSQTGQVYSVGHGPQTGHVYSVGYAAAGHVQYKSYRSEVSSQRARGSGILRTVRYSADDISEKPMCALPDLSDFPTLPLKQFRYLSVSFPNVAFETVPMFVSFPNVSFETVPMFVCQTFSQRCL